MNSGTFTEKQMSPDVDGAPKRAGKFHFPILGAAIFLANFLFFTAFRIGISRDLFGGDTVNLALFRTHSYALQGTDLINAPEFYRAVRDGKAGDPQKNPHALVYSLLSERGREILERVVAGTAAEREREAFLLELNRSWLDRKIDWPNAFLKAPAPRQAFSTGDPLRDENLRTLSQLYPEHIRPEWQLRADVLSIIKNLPEVASFYFTSRVPTRYSPLSNLWVHEFQLYLMNAPERTLVAVMAMGLVYAALMTAVFLLARVLISSIPWALVAMFLYQASISTILSSYSLFSLPYLFVPLVMAAAFYAYVQYKASGQLKGLIAFVGFCVVGPWFREFPGAVPYIVFATELLSFRSRRSPTILILCIPLMLHSIYPSFLPWVLGINKGNVYGVFAQDNTLAQSAGLRFNRNAVGFLFVQFPPILWMLVLLSVGGWLRSTLRELPKLRRFSILLWILLSAGAFYSFFVEANLSANPIKIRHGLMLFLVIGSIALASVRFHPLPSVYFAAMFLPFLRMRLSEMHLSFTLIPFAVIFVWWLRNLLHPPYPSPQPSPLHPLTPPLPASGERDKVRGGGGLAWRPARVKGVIFYVLVGILGWGFADHAMNLAACFWTQRRLVETNQRMADWLTKNIARHSVVVMNFYHMTDVFYASNRYFDPYCSVETCPLDPSKVVSQDADFHRLLNRSWGIRDFYFLAARREYLPWEGNYYVHKYVQNPPGELEKKAEFSARSVYYFLDPMKNLVPRHFVSFPGYMDWSTDFYVNNAAAPFQRVVDATYTLYHLKAISSSS